MRVCKSCEKEKELTEFSVQKTRLADGTVAHYPVSTCKVCRVQLSVEWNKKHPDRTYKSKERYFKNHPDKVAEIQKKHWERHKKKMHDDPEYANRFRKYRRELYARRHCQSLVNNK